ncbi:MAG TPA: SpoIIE family protein phosphatase [Bacteroidales bacterium]|nr:SpoIIE family protein phosphatase [Bacteroidales bacterium]
MSLLFIIHNISSLRIDIIGNTIYHYIFYFFWFGILLYLFIRYQSKSLIQARKLLKEKDQAYKEIARQREELEIKNRNITDSLIYASYIQQALLPSEDHFKRIVPESFIFFRPKDIVSGDFYWARESSGKIFIVAADCTGHGVPGAFMSMIGVELLNKIIIDQNIANPADILYILSTGIERTFTGNNPGAKKMKDGMDIGLCIIDAAKRKLEYSGAFFPLYLIRDNKLIEIKGERLSVGLVFENIFVNHLLDLEENDMIYMFSDGYTDQFGGPHDKKFMYRRFRHLLLSIHSFPMEEQKNILKDSILTWEKGNEQIDDMMVIGLKPLPYK